MFRPDPEGDSALEILAVMAHCGNEVSGDILIQSPCVTPCKERLSVTRRSGLTTGPWHGYQGCVYVYDARD